MEPDPAEVGGEGTGCVRMDGLVDITVDTDDIGLGLCRVRRLVQGVNVAMHEHVPRKIHVGTVTAVPLNLSERLLRLLLFPIRESNFLAHGAGLRATCTACARPFSTLKEFGVPSTIRLRR